MTSINNLLSPDLLFNIFKRLDCIQTTRIRRVCKQWFEIIDEHKSFWRILHLPKNSLKEWDASILELFDQKSVSTLHDVGIEMRVEREQQKRIFDTLEKSKHSLKHLSLRLRAQDGLVSQELLDCFTASESLRLMRWYESYRVRLRRTSIQRDSQEGGSNTANLLKVLWYHGAGRSILEINSARFMNLVSLDSGTFLSSSEWRTFLEGPSRNLKHLKIGFKKGANEDHSGVPKLDFPNLEVLELSSGGRFPRWLLIPDSVKLITHSAVSNLPSISELWSWNSKSHANDIINRLPKLRTLYLWSPNFFYQTALVLEILNERKGNVEAGLQSEGVKMEMIKTLVLPFDLSRTGLSDDFPKNLRKFRELVEVVEGDAQSRFIEVEV